MRVTITIDCDNAAFEADPGAEIARILRQLATDTVRTSEPYDALDSRKLRDINGNTVGQVEVTE